MAFPIVKMGNKNPQNLPFPLHDVDPYVIQQCLGPPHAPPKRQLQQLRHCRTCTQWIRHWLPWCTPNSHPKVPLPVDRSPNRTICLIPGPVRPMMPKASGSDLPFFHNALDRQTDRPTDCSQESLITIAHSASNEMCVKVSVYSSSWKSPQCYGKSHAIWDHSVTCHLAAMTFPPLTQPKLVFNLATPEGCKAELT